MGGHLPAFLCAAAGGLAAFGVVAVLAPHRYRRPTEATLRPPTRPWWLGLVAFALVGLLVPRFGGGSQPVVLAAYVLLVLLGVGLCVVDLDVHRLPDRYLVLGYAGEVVLLAVDAVVAGRLDRLGHAAVAGAIVLAAFVLLALLPGRRQGLGLGDVKLAGLLGLALGYQGWVAVVVGMYAGFLIGGVVALVLVLVRRVGWRGSIAFGPPMLLGAFVGLLLPADALVTVLTG